MAPAGLNCTPEVEPVTTTVGKLAAGTPPPENVIFPLKVPDAVVSILTYSGTAFMEQFTKARLAVLAKVMLSDDTL